MLLILKTFVIVYAGAKWVDKINSGLIIGLGGTFAALIAFGIGDAHLKNLAFTNWTAAIGTIPILLICFGYQNLVPSLTYYLNKNVKALRLTIMIGNFIPFLLYFTWNYIILGQISDPTSAHSDMVTGLLQNNSPSQAVLIFVKAFSICALLTSFIPSALTFVDFLKDGIKLPFLSSKTYDLCIHGLVFLPPLIFTLIYPNLFLKALGFAGGFIDVFLFGILPILIVWMGRYVKKIEGPYTVAGGKPLLLIMLLASISFLLIRQIL